MQNLRLLSELQRLLLIPVAMTAPFTLTRERDCAILRLTSPDQTNKLSLAVITSLTTCVAGLRIEAERGAIRSLIVTGNDRFFSAGADLNEISRLSGPEALAFARLGQKFTDLLNRFPVPVIAAIRGYCMGGGMDLALACGYRIAAPGAIFGHRGASLGLITGWGGTQRLPRLTGKARALQMFLLAEKITAEEALRIGLVNGLSSDPVRQAIAKVEDALTG